MNRPASTRRALLKGIAALTVTERLVALRSAWAAEQNSPQPGVYRVSGQVRVNGATAREGMAIAAGDNITTGPDSEVIYVVGKDAYLQRDHSTVSLLGEAGKDALRVLTGKLLSVFGKGERRIQTAVATIGIRGTGCYLESDASRVYFCLCYGTAVVTPHRAPDLSETITTLHHDHPLLIPAEGKTMMAPASVINHTDAELILLESLVGRTPPFVGIIPAGERY